MENGWRWHVLTSIDVNEFCVLQPAHGDPPGPKQTHGARQESAFPLRQNPAGEAWRSCTRSAAPR